jgi:glutamine amidotransferase
MCTYSEENDTPCLGIFDEEVRKFSRDETLPLNESFKVPQIGWNLIYNVKSKLMAEVDNKYCYFVHSYYASIGEHTIATTNYIHPYSSALHKNNFFGVQFHPEKSADVGEKILKNFITL